ncbi:MAG: hypothetical protein MMC33_002864 [Icmadophila ericetorum]|nr:hypothetical protein [Icmadophila ericetorum]
MTRRDLNCVHEPFGDAFYYGPERLSARFENNEKGRTDSGFSKTTYKHVLNKIDEENEEGKRIFIKDIAYYLFPPEGKPASIAPSLARIEKGVGTNGVNGTPNGIKSINAETTPYPSKPHSELNNPTVLPAEFLKKFHFTFLIRNPRSSIPSYYRCTQPPLDKVTGFYEFMPNEAGYEELHRLFDYLRSTGQVGPKLASSKETSGVNGNHHQNGVKDDSGLEICLIDADDLLDNPNGIIEAYCNSIGYKYDPGMLSWDTEEDDQIARALFAKWPGFHDDAFQSSALKPRHHVSSLPETNPCCRYSTNGVVGDFKRSSSDHDDDAQWRQRFGEKAARVIRETVDANMEHYEYLKQFALKAAITST